MFFIVEHGSSEGAVLQKSSEVATSDAAKSFLLPLKQISNVAFRVLAARVATCGRFIG